MPARPRDLFKSRANRTAEVLRASGLKTGAADGQALLWGSVLSPNGTPALLDVSAGEAVSGGAIQTWAAVAGTAVAAGAATAAGTVRKVLVERDAAGAVSQVVGAAVTTVQADAVLPAGDPTRTSVGWLEIPASFVPGTTAITGGMCKAMPYTG